MTAIGLRSATSADSEYCFQLHKAVMGAYVAAIWGWDEQIQRDFHARTLIPVRWRIITADGADAGMLHVEHRPTEIYLARIEFHPDHQGRGIGSQLIRSLLHQAHQHGRDLTLDVLVVSQRAQTLYRRLGLHEVTRHGENDIKARMSTKSPRPTRSTDLDNDSARRGRGGHYCHRGEQRHHRDQPRCPACPPRRPIGPGRQHPHRAGGAGDAGRAPSPLRPPGASGENVLQHHGGHQVRQRRSVDQLCFRARHRRPDAGTAPRRAWHEGTGAGGRNRLQRRIARTPCGRAGARHHHRRGRRHRGRHLHQPEGRWPGQRHRRPRRRRPGSANAPYDRIVATVGAHAVPTPGSTSLLPVADCSHRCGCAAASPARSPSSAKSKAVGAASAPE